MNNDDKFMESEELDIEKEIVSSPLVKEDGVNAGKKGDKTKRFYFGFEARIITSIILILILFSGACFLGLKVINYKALEKFLYNEDGSVSYQVCRKDSTCIGEMDSYNALDIDRIKIFFNYNIKADKQINHDETYHISANLKAYDSSKTELYYEKENELISKTNISNTNNSIVSKTVIIDYNKYNKLIKEYESRDSLDELEVALYINDDTKSRKVSSVIIPLSNDNIVIGKSNPINVSREMDISVNVWDNYSIIYALSSSILVIISLILIYRTTRLVLKSTNNRNDYQKAVDNILKEYDSIIVVARDGYESNEIKEVIKVNSFDELLEIKDSVMKPIVFTRINGVKSEFIIERNDKLYKYVMKEADFLKDN